MPTEYHVQNIKAQLGYFRSHCFECMEDRYSKAGKGAASVFEGAELERENPYSAVLHRVAGED
jgi:hypothetical protein